MMKWTVLKFLAACAAYTAPESMAAYFPHLLYNWSSLFTINFSATELHLPKANQEHHPSFSEDEHWGIIIF